MSFFTSLGIVILSTLILVFLQLTPAVFAFFEHYASGKFSKKRASYLTIFYVLGVETVAACLFMSMLLISNLFFYYTFRPETSFLAWILAGIMIALALISFVAYYRRGTGTRLFIPRRCAQTLEIYASKADSRSDAFILGAMTGVLELPFTLPLYLIGAISVIELSVEFAPCQLLALVFVLAPTVPLFAVRYKFHAGYNLADLQRTRVHDKNFVRLALSFCYAAIGVLLICFGAK